MKRISLAVLVIILAAAAVSLGFFWPFGPRRHELQLHGTVEVFEIRLGSKVGGRVAEVLVREGQVVEGRTELVQFEAPELKAQMEQVAARLAGAKADLLKAENGPRQQELDQAKALFDSAAAKNRRMETGWREEEKTQAESDLKTAEADLELTKANWERVQKLAAEASRNEYDTARALYRAAIGRVTAARAKRDMLMKGNREEDLQSAAAELARASAHYALLKAGTREEDKSLARAQVAELEAKQKELETNWAETVVRAPSKIVIEVLGVRKGDLVTPNQPIIRALSMEDRWVKVFVPSTELGKVRLNQAVEVTCDAYPNKRFPGAVIQIATISEFTPRNVQSLDERRHQVFAVKVRVDDNGEVFRAGMAAEVFLPLQEQP